MAQSCARVHFHPDPEQVMSKRMDLELPAELARHHVSPQLWAEWMERLGVTTSKRPTLTIAPTMTMNITITPSQVTTSRRPTLFAAASPLRRALRSSTRSRRACGRAAALEALRMRSGRRRVSAGRSKRSCYGRSCCRRPSRVPSTRSTFALAAAHDTASCRSTKRFSR